jgi:Glycosyltransferase family 87
MLSGQSSLRLIAIYAIFCLIWVALTSWVVPNIAADEEVDPSILNLPAAALLALFLHLILVLFIRRIDRKLQARFLEVAQPPSYANAALVMFSAAFLALAVLSGIHGDYRGYFHEWMAILGGRDPWESGKNVEPWVNNYGPVFNLLAPLAWINPLANKLLFAFSYLVYVIWLIKDFAPRRGLVVRSWPWLGLWLLNPFPWEQIAFYGYFDILVSLACVAAVHSLVRNKNGASGTYLGLGILLKYIPIVVLPFLAFSKGHLKVRVLCFCVAVVILGLVVSVLLWGTSTFLPLTTAATRDSIWSIYVFLPSTHSPLRPFLHSLNIDWLANPLLLAAGLGIFTWCILRQIEPALSCALAILVTALFYRVGNANYQMVFFCLISYWSVSNSAEFKNHPVLAWLLFGYFGFLAISNFAFWSGLTGPIFYSEIAIVLLQFILGFTVLVYLAQLQPMTCASSDAKSLKRGS